MRVLVATAERYIARLIQVNLERQGWDVLIASEGTECLMTAMKENLDMVVLDKRLPPIGGLAVMKALQENELSRAIKIVVLGEQTDDWPDDGTGGPSGYLHKPDDVLKLLDLVEV